MNMFSGFSGLKLRMGDFPWNKEGSNENLPPPDKAPKADNELLAYYKDALDFARSLKSEQVSEANWSKYRDAFRNQFENYNLTQNQVYANAKIIVPACTFEQPRVVLVPHNDHRMWFHAKTLEKMDNFFLDRVDARRICHQVSLDTFLFGRSFIKIGFGSEFFQDLSGEMQDEDNRLEYDDIIQPNMPWVMRVDPRDVWFVSQGSSFRSAELVFHRVYRPYIDILDDDRYDGPNLDDMPTPSDRHEPVELFEVYDKKRGFSAVFHEDHGEFVMKPYKYMWWPWDSMAWNEDGDNLWPCSDVDQIWSQQTELNRTREQIRRHSTQILAKIFFDKDRIDEDALAEFLKNEVGIAIPVAGDPGSIVKEFSTSIPGELFLFLDRVESDIRKTLGISANALGEYGPRSRTTALEVSVVNQGTTERLTYRKSEVSSLLTRLVRKINQIVFLAMADKEGGNQIVVESPTGEPVLVTYILDDLKEVDYDIEVNMEDKPSLTSAGEKAGNAQLMQLLAQMPGVNPLELKQLAVDTFGSGRRDVPYHNAPSPEQQQQAQEQNIQQQAAAQGIPAGGQ